MDRFSNRVFIDKAVAGWTGKSDIDHIQRVGDYLYFSGGFQPDSIKALDLLRVTSINSDGDPLYAVIAQAK